MLGWKIDTVRSLQIFKILKFSFIILLSVFLAKSSLSMTDIGIYESLMYIGTAASFYWVSGLLSGMLSVYPKLSTSEQSSFLFSTFILFLAFGSVIMSGLYLTQSWVIPQLSEYESLPYFGLLCIYLTINLPTYLVEYIYVLKEKPWGVISFGLFSFGGQFLAVVLPLYLGYTLEMSFYGLIIIAVAKFIWLVINIIQFGQFTFNPTLLKSFLVVSIPIILYIFIGGIMEYIDLALVGRYFSIEKVPVYRYGAREFPLSIALIGGISAALIPVTAKDITEGLAQLKARTLRAMHILYPTSILLIFCTPFLYPIIYSPEFIESAWITNWYVLLLVSRAMMPQTILIAQEKTKIILWVSIIEILINISLSLFLLQWMGLEGIAIATVIAYMIEKVLLSFFVKVNLGINLRAYLHLSWYLFYSILLFVAFIGSYLLLKT